MPDPVFDLAQAQALLANTPAALDGWLRNLPDAWLTCDEGPETWNAIAVLGHLIEGERCDWIPRARHLLERGEAVPFAPFDRFAQSRREPRPVRDLLEEFATLRAGSLDALRGLRLTPPDLLRRGRHPEFGPVTLGQHLATWVVHDLTHITQIARVMARRYAEAVGPWRAYLRVVRDDSGGGSAR
ncbi:MAG TPA: DinB family protein [Planctomycetota bacterium]|nr:DinB family protein [Planctomycetota bacterium]